jgi:hypothetical protein
VTHPDPLALVRHVCEPGAREDAALERHLAECPACTEEVRRIESLRAVLRVNGDDGPPGPECLDDDTLAALAAAELEGSARTEALAHVAACGHCRRVAASLADVLADPAVSAARADSARAPGYRFLRFAVPAAAAAAVVVAVLGPDANRALPPTTHRAPQTAPIGNPVPTSPRGLAGRPTSLRWESVAGADLYRVTLFQRDGRVIYRSELRDTADALPDSVRLAAGGTYLWKVEARTGWNRWTSSSLVEFSIEESEAK